MNIVSTFENGWKLISIEYGEQSPLENHGAFELGSDDENKAIYASETMIRTYGTDSVIAACTGYAAKRNKGVNDNDLSS